MGKFWFRMVGVGLRLRPGLRAAAASAGGWYGVRWVIRRPLRPAICRLFWRGTDPCRGQSLLLWAADLVPDLRICEVLVLLERLGLVGGGISWERERLLESLEAYRRGLSDAPLLRKWYGGGVEAALDGGGLDGAGATAAADGVQQLSGGPEGKAAADGVSQGAGYAGGKQAADRVQLGAEYTGVSRVASGGVEAEGAMTFVVSSEEPDRQGDVVTAAGWELAAYRRNPVLLWAHDYTRPVIGRAMAVWAEPGLLLARMEFAPTDFAREVAALYRSGYQQGVSVGFKPLRYTERRQEQTGVLLGIRFLEQELLEISAVPVPANRQALRRAMAAAPRVGDYLARAAEFSAVGDSGVSPGLAAALAQVRAGL